MKQKLTLAALLLATSMQAQYFQRWFNRSLVQANMVNESFYDAIRTRSNFQNGNPNNWFNVGIGQTNLSPVGFVTTDHARFVRTHKSGAPVNVNLGYEFADNNTVLWHNSHGVAMCEISNAAGNGGYLAVGNVMSNAINGSVISGGADGLFFKLNGAGNASARYKFDINGQADFFTDIVASTVTPGTYYLCGYTVSPAGDRAIVASVTANGAVNWFRNYVFDPTWPTGTPPSADCRAFGLVEDANTGNVVVVGAIRDMITPNLNGNDGLVFTLSSTGAYICATMHHVFIDDQYHDIIQKANGLFAITGFCGDGNQVPAAFYHTWLTEMAPGCGLISSFIYDHGFNGAFNQSKGYRIIERVNTAGAAEYYIAGPSWNSAAPMMASISKINQTLVNPAVAWYNYAAQSGSFEDGFGLDYAQAANTKPGLLLLSNTNVPAPTVPFDDSYMVKAYFNGATCTNYCPNNLLLRNPAPIATTTLPCAIDTIYKRKGLAYQSFSYVTQLICTQNAVACGSNAREMDGVAEPGLNQIFVYPVPANEAMTVMINNTESGVYYIEAIDVTGRQILLADEYLSAGESEVHLDISQLAKGVYTLIVRNNSMMMSKKFIVQ